MLVLNLMNSNENWREVLSNAPYNISIKEEDGYVLLKYNQLKNDNVMVFLSCLLQ